MAHAHARDWTSTSLLIFPTPSVRRSIFLHAWILDGAILSRIRPTTTSECVDRHVADQSAAPHICGRCSIHLASWPHIAAAGSDSGGRDTVVQPIPASRGYASRSWTPEHDRKCMKS